MTKWKAPCELAMYPNQNEISIGRSPKRLKNECREMNACYPGFFSLILYVFTAFVWLMIFLDMQGGAPHTSEFVYNPHYRYIHHKQSIINPTFLGVGPKSKSLFFGQQKDSTEVPTSACSGLKPKPPFSNEGSHRLETSTAMTGVDKTSWSC